MRRINSLFLIAVLVLINSCAVGRQQAFSFIQICDPQLGMGGYEHDVESLKQAVEQINNIDCDFVVICGDLVNHANDTTYADFLHIIEKFETPCYLVPGNHDVGNIPNDTTLAYYRSKLGKDYYHFNNKGISFILTNSQLWKCNIGEESEKHDTWFRETIRELGTHDSPIIVIGHFPLYVEHVDEEEQYFNFPPGKRQELLDLFAKNNVKAYLSGHKHETLLNTYNGIQLVSGETTSKNFDDRPFGFRHWKVSEDTIIHEFVPLQALKSQSKVYFEFTKQKAQDIIKTGFNAGGGYGEVWIRDYNTFIELSAQVYEPVKP